MAVENPCEVLGISEEAGAEEVRAAYLRKVKEFPPERAPAEFERVRDAYDALRDPRSRARHLFFGGRAVPDLHHLLEGHRAQRRFLGPKPWLAAMKEN
jgi:curved DNA-binding protein CbpA